MICELLECRLMTGWKDWVVRMIDGMGFQWICMDGVRVALIFQAVRQNSD